MLKHCFAPLGKIATVDEILDAWGATT
jgi:hypothetical protein